MADILMVLINWIHILGFVVWLGGAIFFSLILVPNLSSLAPPEAGKLMGAVEKQFTPIAWLSLGTLAITGLLRMFLTGTLNTGYLFGSTGKTMLLKLLVFAAIVVVGYMITTTAKKLGSASGPEEAMGLQKQLGKLSKTNIALGVIVILLAVALNYGGF